MKRYLISAGFAIVVVTAIFLLMIQLIHQQAKARPETKAVVISADIIKEKKTKPKTRRKKPPEKKELKKPAVKPLSKIDNLNQEKTDSLVDVNLSIDSTQLGTGLHTGGGSRDQILTPIVTIEPQYPLVALRENLEGWVTLGFTVTRSGTVRDVQILSSKPRRVFDRAALKALQKWKYRPEIINGQTVESPDQVVTLEFNLEDS